MNAEKQLEIPSMKGLVAAFEVGKKSQDPKLVRKNFVKMPISKLYVIFSCSFLVSLAFYLQWTKRQSWIQNYLPTNKQVMSRLFNYMCSLWYVLAGDLQCGLPRNWGLLWYFGVCLYRKWTRGCGNDDNWAQPSGNLCKRDGDDWGMVFIAIFKV